MDKVLVITGATSGIGLALAGALLEQRMSVIGVGRSAALARQVEGMLRARFPDRSLHYCVAELSMQSQVRQLAVEVERVLGGWQSHGLAGLVNNAGTFTFWRRETTEGFETQWAVNHLAPFLLTRLLLPALQAAPRAKVIMVSSGSHRKTDLAWDDLQLSRRYNPLQAYRQTKLANILFTYEFNKRFGQDSNVRAFAVNPGLVDTSIGEKTGLGIAKWFWAFRRRKAISADESAEGIVTLLQNKEAAQSGEIYWVHGQPLAADPRALDPEASGRLWKISSEMCGLIE
jgi:NAD(P)-dependent dehydrogenase (short-subunit alcohol dehydrogenase family)